MTAASLNVRYPSDTVGNSEAVPTEGTTGSSGSFYEALGNAKDGATPQQQLPPRDEDGVQAHKGQNDGDAPAGADDQPPSAHVDDRTMLGYSGGTPSAGQTPSQPTPGTGTNAAPSSAGVQGRVQDKVDDIYKIPELSDPHNSEPDKALDVLGNQYALTADNVKQALLADPRTKKILQDAANKINENPDRAVHSLNRMTHNLNKFHRISDPRLPERCWMRRLQAMRRDTEPSPADKEMLTLMTGRCSMIC